MKKLQTIQFLAEWSKEIDGKIEKFKNQQGCKTKREALRQILRQFFENLERGAK